MKNNPTGFRAYFPDDGEGPDDAYQIKVYSWQKIFDSDDAVSHACEYDYSDRDGWERGMSGGQTEPFSIVIIAPDGMETRYKGWHEPSIEHRTERDGDEDRQRLQAGEGQGRQDQGGS